MSYNYKKINPFYFSKRKVMSHYNFIKRLNTYSFLKTKNYYVRENIFNKNVKKTISLLSISSKKPKNLPYKHSNRLNLSKVSFFSKFSNLKFKRQASHVFSTQENDSILLIPRSIKLTKALGIYYLDRFEQPSDLLVSILLFTTGVFKLNVFQKFFNFDSNSTNKQMLNFNKSNLIINDYNNVNLNVNSILYSLYGSSKNNNNKRTIELNNLFTVKVKLSNNFKYDSNSIWSNFYNSIFMSKSKNVSARSLYMSVGVTEQKLFWDSNILFADVKFNNFYLDSIIYKLESLFNNKSRKSILLLTQKDKVSFLNKLAYWSDTIQPSLITHSDFLISDTDSNLNNFTNLRTNSISLSKLYKYSKIKKLSLSKNKRLNNTNNTKIMNLRLKNYIKHNMNFVLSLAEDFEATSLTFENDIVSDTDTIQELQSKRQKFIEKKINQVVFKTKHDSALSHIDDSECLNGFYDTTLNLNSKIKNNSIGLFSFNTNKNISFIKFKLNDFLNLLVKPNVFLLKFYFREFLSLSFDYYTSFNNLKLLNNFFNKFVTRFNFSQSLSLSVSTNLVPSNCFNFSIFKKVSGSHADGIFTLSCIPWHYNTMIRFMEFCSGRKILFQFYPFLYQSVEKHYIIIYKRWMSRLSFYEKNLGHKFFLEEALHLIHLSLTLHDPRIMCSWLKSMIKRISFWKTRSIFRFLRYLFRHYFMSILQDLGVKGLKLCLRGKISAAGNSRTRTILYRLGKTSHGDVSLKVLNEFTTIGTFTGVLGFQIWIFY